MKRWMKIVAITFVVLLVVSVIKDIAFKTALEKGTEIVTGLRLSTGGFSVGVLRPVIRIKDLKLYNPKGFEDPVMADAPEIYVDYVPLSFIGGKIHLKEVRFNLAEFTVVKNKDGKLNLDSLKSVSSRKQAKPAAAKPGKALQMKIDKLTLKIGKAVYKDYSAGSTPSVMEFNVNINETYTNIEDPAILVSLVVVKALANTSIASMANFDVKGLSGSVSDALANAGKTMVSAQKTAAQTEQTVKKAAESLSGMFKSLGSKE